MKKAKERKLRGRDGSSTEGVSGDESEQATDKDLEQLRNDLIAKAGICEITPQQAEAEAKAAGLPPLAFEPPAFEYNPMLQSRWAFLQAVAWIAWREPGLARDFNQDFRRRCTRWRFQEWDQSVQNGSKFVRREGWFLEPWWPASGIDLQIRDRSMREAGALPKTAQLTPGQAERDLLRCLSEGQLIAEGLDRLGTPVEIPSREWEYIKLCEDKRGRQVFRYNLLDRDAAYSEVRFKRDDLIAIWPRGEAVDLDALQLESMLDLPLGRIIGKEVYVPLSLAICWVATRGGVNPTAWRDESDWRTAAAAILREISDGRIEVFGYDKDRLPNVVPRTIFTSIAVSHPLSEIAGLLPLEETYLSSRFFIGEQEWLRGFNDQLYLSRNRRPAWTHLQARRAQIEKLWPKPSATSYARSECQRWLSEEIKASPEIRPHPKSYYWELARKRFKRITERQFLMAWDAAIVANGADAWSKAGRPKGKSNHRAG
jgi:hypothetical protein